MKYSLPNFTRDSLVDLFLYAIMLAVFILVLSVIDARVSGNRDNKGKDDGDGS